MKNSITRYTMKDRKLASNDSVFLQLGLTEQQTKVYLALSKLEQATVKTIAMTAQMDRAEVYRVIPELQKLGLIKRIISSPLALRAIPLSEGLSILLQQDAEKHKEKQARAKRFLRNFNHNKEELSQVDNQYILTRGARAEIREFLKNMQEAQTSIDAIFEWKAFLYVFKTHYKEYERVLERGVKIRRIVNKPKNAQIPQFIQALQKKGSFKIKCVTRIPRTGVEIWDGKFACIVTSPNDGEQEIEVLRSRNSTMLKLVRDYFDMKWQTAKPC